MYLVAVSIVICCLGFVDSSTTTAQQRSSKVQVSLSYDDRRFLWHVGIDSKIVGSRSFVAEPEFKDVCPEAGTMDDFYRDPDLGTWSSGGESFISTRSNQRCPLHTTCDTTLLNRYYAEIPTCSCGVCVRVDRTGALWDVQNASVCKTAGHVWIVGSQGCLAAAFALRNDRARAQVGEEIVLYRLIGNDMPPLESEGQLLRNTLYALRNEPTHLPNTRRRWILNRVLSNDTVRALRESILDTQNYKTEDILVLPFDKDVMCGLPSELLRLLYRTNQNAARNAAFRHAQRDGFEWILVFDGNGFVTRDTWSHIAGALFDASRAGKKVMETPMVRVFEGQRMETLNENTTLRNVLTPSPGVERITTSAFAEAQLAFRRDLLPPGTVPYDRNLHYGSHNKMELLALCGDRTAMRPTDRGRAEYLSMYWKEGLCHCREELQRASMERGYLWRPSHTPPGTHDARWTRRANLVGERNAPIAARCGLWIRLWAWPDPEKLREALSVPHAKQFHCTDGDDRMLLRSVAEDRKCRSHSRTVSHEIFRAATEKMCTESEWDGRLSATREDVRRNVSRVVNAAMADQVMYVSNCYCDWTNRDNCVTYHPKHEDHCHGVCCAEFKARSKYIAKAVTYRLAVGSEYSNTSAFAEFARNVSRNAVSYYLMKSSGEQTSMIGDCECSWATKSACRHDDGTHCYAICCREIARIDALSLRRYSSFLGPT